MAVRIDNPQVTTSRRRSIRSSECDRSQVVALKVGGSSPLGHPRSERCGCDGTTPRVPSGQHRATSPARSGFSPDARVPTTRWRVPVLPGVTTVRRRRIGMRFQICRVVHDARNGIGGSSNSLSPETERMTFPRSARAAPSPGASGRPRQPRDVRRRPIDDQRRSPRQSAGPRLCSGSEARQRAREPIRWRWQSTTPFARPLGSFGRLPSAVAFVD